MLMKNPTSTVVFDLGKVLVDFDYSIAVRRIAARSRRSLRELSHFVPLLTDYELGRLTTRQFFDRVRADTGYEGDLEEFSVAFGDIFAAIEPMVDLHAALRQQNVPTYIFSNTNDLAVRHISRTFPFFAHFDGYILSYEHGFMKPQPELYEVVERRTGRQGADLLYIDDRPENIEAGAARGWRVVLHESGDRTRAAVRASGLLEGL